MVKFSHLHLTLQQEIVYEKKPRIGDENQEALIAALLGCMC